jgi:hypothetical protein
LDRVIRIESERKTLCDKRPLTPQGAEVRWL